MIQFRGKLVVDGKGTRVGVFLPIKDYNKLLEELDDIKAFDKAVCRKQEFVPLDQAIKEIQASRKKKK